MANKKDFIASGPTKPDIMKSHFDWSFTNNLTATFGKMYPLGSWLCPAGSHFKCDTDYGFDLQPLVFPVQTNMRFHVKFYKAPLRILWKNWRNFVSRGGKGYEMPYINRDTNFYKTGSLSDYMGVPSFQSTNHDHDKIYNFGFVFPIIDSEYNLNDVVHFANPSDLGNISYLSPYYSVVTPLSGRSLALLKSGTFKILFNTAQAPFPIINSSVYVYLARVNGYTSENYPINAHIIKKVNLSESGATISREGAISTITLPDNIFGDSIEYSMLSESELCFIMTFDSQSNFYKHASTNFSISTFDVQQKNETIDEQETTVFRYPTLNITNNNRSINRPVVLRYTYTVTTGEGRATHFQSVNGQKPKLPLLAFRWRMYEFIYNYFVRNERVTPFMLPDDNDVMQQVFNQYLTNDGDGADSTTPVDFKYMPYEYDLFTTCVKKPTFGDAPLVGVSFNYDMSGDTPSGEFLLLKEGDVTPESYQVSLDGDGRLTGITAYSEGASNPNLHNLQELINFGISINDLRNVSAYQRYLERLTKAGTKYENIMYEFFGTNPPIGEEFPSYLGGYTDLIRTDKVLNQTMSNDAKLGEYGGNAYLRSKGGRRSIKAYCQEDCYIMAIGWFSVTPTYSQKLDKDFVYTSYLDFVNPQFASISPQPVYDYQIAPLELDPDNDEELHHVFGYNRPFAEAVSRQDECHGLFRSNMQNFIMQRIFAGAPQLNDQFLYMRPEDLTQIFAVTETTDKIFGQIHFDVNATLPLPHMALPKIV